MADVVGKDNKGRMWGNPWMKVPDGKAIMPNMGKQKMPWVPLNGVPGPLSKKDEKIKKESKQAFDRRQKKLGVEPV